MSRESVRMGVIGLGAIGPSHIHAMKETAGCELGAICDVRAEVAAGVAAEQGVPYFGAISDMLAAGVVDAVSICTPSGLHLDAALEVIEAGKHLLVEKPLEITTDRADQIIAAAAARGVKLAAVYQSRHRSTVRRLRGLVDAGMLGEIYSGSAYLKRYRTQEYYDSGGWRGTWQIDGGGCLMNQGIHIIDLFAWFLGEVDEVIAMTDNVGRDVEVETLALSLVKFRSGARGVIEGSTLAYPELPQYLEIYGSRGTLTFDPRKVWRLDLIDPTPEEQAARQELLTRAESEATAKQNEEPPPAGTPIPSVDMGHGPVIADFVEAIRADRPPEVDGAEARRAIEIITAIYESGRRNSAPVRLGSQ